MRKKVATLLTVAFLISISLTANAAVKPGITCKKLGSTSISSGKKYTCIKSGKKWVWSKAVIIKALAPTPTPTASPTPTPTPTPTPSVFPTATTMPTPKEIKFEPWSTNSSAKALSDVAQKNFLDWAKLQVLKPEKHLLFVQDGVPPIRLRNMRKSDELSSKLFSQYFPTKSVTVIGVNEDWVINQILNSNGNLRNSQNTCRESMGTNLFGCMNRISHHGYIVRGDQDFQESRPFGDGVSVIAHEYFHLVQIALADNVSGPHWNYGDSQSANSFPVWLVEGSAEFVGYSIAANAMESSYWSGRQNALQNYPKDQPYLENQISDYEVRPISGSGGLYPYNIGQIATEFIVASIGFPKFLEIWKDYASTRNFEVSFEKVTGISKQIFYNKFEELRLNIGLPEVKWKLVCEKNSIINKEIRSLSETERSTKLDSNNCIKGN